MRFGIEVGEANPRVMEERLLKTVEYLVLVPSLGFPLKPTRDSACLRWSGAQGLQPGGKIVIESVTDSLDARETEGADRPYKYLLEAPLQPWLCGHRSRSP